jgi:hypothetical protein
LMAILSAFLNKSQLRRQSFEYPCPRPPHVRGYRRVAGG